jgi:uncharacterized protein (TIGR03083 family)
MTTTTLRGYRAPAIDHTTAMRLAATEYDRCTRTFRGLSGEDWTRSTDCPGWDVRAMGAHMLGMLEMAASLREMRRQQKAARKRGGDFLGALTAVQVEERAELTTDELVQRFARKAPKAVTARRLTPALIRRRIMPDEQPIGDGATEPWTFGYLLDVILTRDPWMHRVDICRATGHQLQVTRDHDGVLVADVVAEWAHRHGQAYTLHLTGPAGGHWAAGSGGAEVELDAIEFCRLLSGRGVHEGLLGTRVPF